MNENFSIWLAIIVGNALIGLAALKVIVPYFWTFVKTVWKVITKSKTKQIGSKCFICKNCITNITTKKEG